MGQKLPEDRPTGEVDAVWAGTISTHVLEGVVSTPSTAADEADLVVLSDGSHLASVVRLRNSSGEPLGLQGFMVYPHSALPTYVSTTLDVGPGLVLLRDHHTVSRATGTWQRPSHRRTTARFRRGLR